jgi:hypothetical protein
MNWKQIALRLARAVIRFDIDPYALNLKESTVKLAQRAKRKAKGPT